MSPSARQLEIRPHDVPGRFAACDGHRTAGTTSSGPKPRRFAQLAGIAPLRDRFALSRTPVGQVAWLPPRERDALTRLFSNREVRAGLQLVTQGQGGEAFFVIAEGYVAVIRNGKRVASLGPGDFFGEIALIDNGRRTASVIATTDVRLRILGQLEFDTAMRTLPHFARVVRDARQARLATPRS